jgi:glycosyltransferase involved in cell wall biosynthesis
MATNLERSTIITNLTYIVSHPIQYQAPLLRLVAKERGIRLRVIFENNPESQAYYDPDFKRSIIWDLPLTDGYENTFLTDTCLLSEIKNSDILWLHGWSSPVMRKALMLARRLRTPVLMRGENCDLAMPDGTAIKSWIKRLYLAWIFQHCTAFLAIGTENKNYYLDRGVAKKQIFLTPYAVDNESFRKKAKAAQSENNKLRSDLGIIPNQKVILFSGKFMPRKQPDILINAMNRIDWKDSREPALVFVGGGEMEGKLRTQAPNAIFLGFKNQSELPSIYSMADVMVLPSKCEPWGLAVNEAMACGTAIIVSDQVGCAKDLLDDKCGKIFPCGDTKALADTLVHCLEHSEKMGLAASATIRKWGFAEDIVGLKEAIHYVEESNVINP